MGVTHQIVGKHCDWSAVHRLSYLNKSFESFQILALVKLLLLEANTRVSESSGTVGDLLMESHDWLIGRFRLARHIIMDLHGTFEAQLRRENRRSNAKPVLVQVLATFDIVATGTFRWQIGDRAGVSHLTISRVLPDVAGAIKVLSSK